MPAIVLETAAKPTRLAHTKRRLNVQVVRTCGAFTILTSKCASRHSGVNFLSTWLRLNFQKWSENLVFPHFYFQMCFAPQHALFGHSHCQNCSGPDVVLAFWLPNLLRATTACNFSSLIWPDGSAPASVFCDFDIFSRTCIFSLLTLCFLTLSLPWLFSPLLFHLSILSEVWLLNFLCLLYVYLYVCISVYPHVSWWLLVLSPF